MLSYLILSYTYLKSKIEKNKSCSRLIEVFAWEPVFAKKTLKHFSARVSTVAVKTSVVVRSQGRAHWYV